MLGWKCTEKSIRFLLSAVKPVVLHDVAYIYTCGLTNVHVYRLLPLPSSSPVNWSEEAEHYIIVHDNHVTIHVTFACLEFKVNPDLQPAVLGIGLKPRAACLACTGMEP